MSHAALKRSRLLVGCGSAALALGLLLGPAPAAAQGILAEPAVVLGNASIENTSPTDTVIEVRSPTVVIDWTPNEDQFGNALDFLRAGATATFLNPQGPQMAVLNRILPSTNGNIAVIDGAVIGRITTAAGPTPGGTIAFYSPTGLLIGGTATFDVGSLLLTTLDATDTGFQDFAEQGANLTLTGAQGSTARISIAAGAQITATPENAFFAVVAADVEMRGIARINGSHAYVAGEVVNLTFSNGLFDISVPVGTAAAGEVVTLDGTVGGPSSTGNVNDNHMIYAVARASADPIRMLFSGNLGFDPAQSAGVVNGEIILSANYNVSGRTVNGGSIADGANATFAGNAALTNVRADIDVRDFTASSRLLAIGTHSVRAAAIGAASSVAGNLQLVSRERAELIAANGRNMTVTGETLVDTRAYGLVGSIVQGPNAIDAEAGISRIEALTGGTVTLNNRVLVTADAQAGANAVFRVAGRALAGQAEVAATGGTINIAGETTISARAFGTNVGGILTGADARGGLARLFASLGGQVTIGQNLLVTAAAVAAQSDLANPSTVSNSFGGNATIRAFVGGGTINVGGTTLLDANAFAGAANAVGGGALADAGEATVSIEGPSTVVFGSNLELSANAFGGNNGNGQGGQARGGASRLLVAGTGASVTVNGNFAATARAEAGNGTSGGDGFGGIAGANAFVGTIDINGSALANAEAFGGAANFGFGGNGGLGRGGNAFFQADGTLTEAARVTITGNAAAFANGTGGAGGATDAVLGTPAGRGGDGIGGQFTVPNQADPNRNSGAFILAGGDNGTIEVGGDAHAAATGFGGRGGDGTSVLAGGLGGNGFGGLAQVGLALLGQNGSLGQGIARFANLRAEADGFGGSGGFSLNDFPTGLGGNGTGGSALLTVRAGDVTASQIELRAVGTGGDGVGAGSGTGGTASVLGSLGGTLTASGLNILAGGVGGAAVLGGAGGNGFGGRAAIEGDGITVTVNGNALIDATATGGAAELGAGGNGTGGQALIATVTPANGGTVTITGHAQVFANGDGGATAGAFAGGTGTGGLAYVDALGGGVITLGSAQVHAVGRGGVSQIHEGGDGIGGTVRLNAGGTGSRLTIQNNVPGGFGNAFGGLTLANANGLGAVTVGGDGIGGLGRGGTLDLIAAQGGTLTLPVGTPTSYFARGFGGNSSAQGGTGGAAFGGTAAITVDGGTMVAGTATLSAFAQAGNSADATRDITGGNATGGTRRIRVINGGTLSMEGNGGGAGGQGGNGSGTGNGGDALAGSVLMEIIDSTANLAGNFILFNQSAGGNGQRGGNASGGTIFLNATNAQINLAPGASGPGVLTLSNAMQGGQGVIAGGNAVGGTVTATITGTQIGGGRLDFTQTATGGNAVAATGTGGNANGATLSATFTNSTLNLAGEVIFSADARGGVGGTAGTGGTATGGTADISLVGTTANIVADQQGNPGILRVRAQANGGTAGQTGNATGGRALLRLDAATLTASAIDIDARALANTAASDQLAGAASGGEALLNLAGLTQVTAGQLQVTGLAETSQAGSAAGGRAAIEALTGSAATLNIAQITASADAITGANATGGIAGTTLGGQALVSASGGNLTITGDVQVTARGVGAAFSDVVTGAAARGGNAQLRALQGGNVTLNGNITLDASATGSRGSLTSPSSASNAFGGNALMLVLASGGSLTINGNATANAGARGGSSNNAGAGSLADAGVAVANVEAAGTIDVTGFLTLDARAQGGENAGGTGGVALGGRASTTTFGGGTIRLGRLNADSLAVGGNGRTGGNAFGGIAGANAILGEIAINGRAFAGSEGVGGSATYGVGGTGGLGRGGNSFFQADGNQTQTARLSITGDAIAFAQGVGGNGGNGDAVTAGGRGGDGFGGGQGNVANQADPAFGSGAFILAGGDNGTIIIGGEAVAVGTAAGGRGGNGGPGTAGGRGGDAFGGLAQAGLALLGGTGAVGLGSAQFNRLLAQTDAFAGNGGIASLAAQNGDGGNGTAGTSVLTVRAGNVSASTVEIAASGFGGRGATGGDGRGGFAGVFGSLNGTLSLGQLQVIANGFGEDSNGIGNGGNGRGGEAFLDFSSMQTTITGDVLVEASGFGDAATVGIGGNGIGGTARVGTLGTGAGNGTIAGNTRIFANGAGGVAPTGGSGFGGLAEAVARNGSLSRFGSLQVTASGEGATANQGGNGTGGTANLLASGAGSQLVVLRNTPGGVGTPLNEAAILAAIGRGGNTTGGNGIGGTGTGGTIQVTAQGGGTVALPAQPFNDPGTIGFNRLFARGYGGGSSVEGGAGGTGAGGNARLVVDGGTLSMGETVLSAFGLGGSSLDPSRNIAGGAGFGGERLVRVINGGVANLNLIGGVSGGQGGNGSGTGDGGNATGGTGLIEVTNATLNITGELSVVDQSTGGNGQRGGNAVGNGPNGGLRFIATGATINVTPNASGAGGIFMGGVTAGGQGVVAGGSASAPDVTLTLANTQINGGTIRLEPLAQGGAASAATGIGGAASAGLVSVIFSGSNLSLAGEVIVQSDARGGAGGADGQGGSASAGAADLTLAGSTLAIGASATGQPGTLRVFSRATGGLGGIVGNATSDRAILNLVGGSLNAGEIFLAASATAAGGTGQTGGTATGGEALIALAGSSTLAASRIEIAGNGVTSAGGTAQGGLAALSLASGGTPTVNAAQLRMEADATGGTPGGLANIAGRFSVSVDGGNVNLGSLTARANGDGVAGDVSSSELVAAGGNLNVADNLFAYTIDNLLIRSGSGGVIGGTVASGSTTAIQLDAGKSIEIRGDGSTTGGLGGQSISLLAGRSIVVNGNIASRNGPITLTANHGGGQALAQPGASVITMTQSGRIDAGTGTVTMRLLDGGGDPQRTSGAIQLAGISAGRIDVRNQGTSPGSDIRVLAGGVLTASGTGRAIDLASLSGEVVNLAGDAGLVLTGGGHYGIFAATPTGSQIGSFANYARRYNVADAAAYDVLNPGGNFAAFRFAPVLTVTANNATRVYGNANPAFTASFTGFLPGDGIANISGTPQFGTSATVTSNIGTFAITAALGSLLSEQGYQFTFAPGVLTITPRPITVTANNLSRVYGNANPALTFTVGGDGLANGDQLVGALVTSAGATTGVGIVPITQGTLAASANYVLTFVAGQLTITPRPLTITAANQSKLFGQPDPALTFALGGDGLVNGDQLTGALARDPGEGLGGYAIRQGTLTAGSNYAITFGQGEFTIKPPPAPPELSNPTVIDSIAAGSDPVTASEAEEEERFGMDFPEQPDAPLISEDPLLDDPVSSGGDASLYAGGSAPRPAGGEK